MTTSPTEARVQALIEKIRIFARLRIQETKTAAGEDFRATEQHFDKLESALRAELGKDAERLTDFSEIRTVIHELKTYNPDGDEYKGAHIHKGWAKRLEFALSRQMTFEEAKLLEATLEDFADCGETNTPYEQLLNWAQRGYLESTNFHSMPAAQKAIDAAIQQTKDTK